MFFAKRQKKDQGNFAPEPQEVGTMPWPCDLTYDRGRDVLTIIWDNDTSTELTAAQLRAASPSAEMRRAGFDGHMPSRDPADYVGVTVTDMQAVGHYAVRLHFSDGHKTGLYRWATLWGLGKSTA